MAAPEAVAAIHRAAEEGDVEEVARMLDEDPGLLMDRDLFAKAASSGHVGVARLLLARGTSIDALDGAWLTALHHAASRGHEEMVQFLLTNGADPSTLGLGATALMSASANGRAGVVRLLLPFMGGRGLDVSDDSGWTALWHACNHGSAEIVRVLLLAGADHTIASRLYGAPRQVAQEQGHHHCVAVIERWETEPQRAYVLHKARTLHEDTTTHQQAPAAPVPAYLSTRVQAGNAVPSVDVGAAEQGGEEGAAKRGREEGGQEKAEELCAMAQYVVKGLNEQLYTELMQGFRR